VDEDVGGGEQLGHPFAKAEHDDALL